MRSPGSRFRESMSSVSAGQSPGNPLGQSPGSSGRITSPRESLSSPWVASLRGSPRSPRSSNGVITPQRESCVASFSNFLKQKKLENYVIGPSCYQNGMQEHEVQSRLERLEEAVRHIQAEGIGEAVRSLDRKMLELLAEIQTRLTTIDNAVLQLAQDLVAHVEQTMVTQAHASEDVQELARLRWWRNDLDGHLEHLQNSVSSLDAAMEKMCPAPPSLMVSCDAELLGVRQHILEIQESLLRHASLSKRTHGPESRSPTSSLFRSECTTPRDVARKDAAPDINKTASKRDAGESSPHCTFTTASPSGVPLPNYTDQLVELKQAQAELQRGLTILHTQAPGATNPEDTGGYKSPRRPEAAGDESGVNSYSRSSKAFLSRQFELSVKDLSKKLDVRLSEIAQRLDSLEGRQVHSGRQTSPLIPPLDLGFRSNQVQSSFDCHEDTNAA